MLAAASDSAAVAVASAGPMLQAMIGSRPPEPETEPAPQGRKTAGAWFGYVIFAVVLAYLIFFDVRAIDRHGWPDVVGATAVIAVFLTIPVGGPKRLRRLLASRKAAGPLPGDDPPEWQAPRC